MARCARSLTFYKTVTDGTSPGSRLQIAAATVAFTLRIVTAAGAAVAWTLGPDSGTGALFHFVAGEAYSPGNLKLDADLYLRVVAVNGSVVELMAWSA